MSRVRAVLIILLGVGFLGGCGGGGGTTLGNPLGTIPLEMGAFEYRVPDVSIRMCVTGVGVLPVLIRDGPVGTVSLFSALDDPNWVSIPIADTEIELKETGTFIADIYLGDISSTHLKLDLGPDCTDFDRSVEVVRGELTIDSAHSYSLHFRTKKVHGSDSNEIELLGMQELVDHLSVIKRRHEFKGIFDGTWGIGLKFL